jgi:glycosyltransferase involved in cell wall biosynthesis
MHILIINSEFPPVGGGAGNASAQLAKSLVDLGQEVTVLTTRFGDLPYYMVCGGVRIRRVPAVRNRADRSGALEQITFMLGASWGALRFARRWRPDVTIAFFGVPSGPAAWVLKRYYRIPYIVSLRGGDVPGSRPYDFATYHRLIAPLVRIIWRGAAAVVANSEGLRSLAHAFAPNVDIRVIPNGVDPDMFQPVKRSWDNMKMLFVGRIVYQKGLDLLFQALVGLRDMSWQLTVVGDGPQRDSLQSMAETIGIADRVYFAGWQPREALVEFYQQANLFVFPSRHEGMPNVVLEAMASGLPVIATSIAGNEELVIPDETGLLVPPEGVVALREALCTLLSDPVRCQAMGRASRQRIVRHYTWEMAAREYLSILEEIVASK